MSDRAQSVESQIKELKVSGHTMTLEPGLYCVYNAPGGPAVTEAGLPGVRITAAPRGGQGQISVSTFTADGWIGVDSAALVRVAKGRADLLVTVYQAKDSQTEAPKLQVVLLSAEPATAPAPAETPPPAPAQPEPIVPTSGKTEVVAHVYGAGDVACGLGEWIGEPGSQRWIEGFGVAPPEGIEATDIEYQAVLGRGWLSPWSQGGQFCGSRGMSLPILGLRVRLRGEAAKSHRIVLSATFVDGARIGPLGDGEPCEAANLSALEAFQLTLEPIAATTAEDAPKVMSVAPARGRKVKAPAVTAPTPVKMSKTKAAPIATEPPPEVPVQAPASTKPARKPGKAAPVPAPEPVAAAKPARAPKMEAPVRKPAKAATPAAPPAAPPAAVANTKAKPAARAAKRTPATTRRR